MTLSTIRKFCVNAVTLQITYTGVLSQVVEVTVVVISLPTQLLTVE